MVNCPCETCKDPYEFSFNRYGSGICSSKYNCYCKDYIKWKENKSNVNNYKLYFDIKGKDGYYCPRCNIKMDFESYFIGMMDRYRLGNESEIYICPKCGEQMKALGDNYVNPYYYCSYCRKDYPRKIR